MIDVAALFESHHGPLRGFIAKRMDGADPALIEDMTADVFERAIRAAPHYQDRGHPPEAWLYRIARNLLIDHYRHYGLLVVVRLGDIKPYVEHVGTSDHLARIDARVAVSSALETLTDLQRTVIVGRFYEGRRHKEMGHVATPNGSKKLQDRALVNLRRALEAA